jgi:thioredoxin 1
MQKEPIHVNDEAFEKAVLKSTIPVIVDFWAPWCGPCHMVAPSLEQLASEYAGKVLVAKVNTDEDAQYAMQYGVRGIPTLLFIKDGQEVDRVVGVTPLPILKSKLEAILPVMEQ